MKLKIEIDLGNAAFDDPLEASRLLRETATGLWFEAIHNAKEKLAPCSRMIADSNGNRVGFYRITR